MTTPCPFCVDSVHPNAPGWIPTQSRLLGTVGEISICAGLGAIVQPYVLAYPRLHILGISELAAHVRRDLIDVLDWCLETNLFPSRKLTVFEHGGRSSSETTGCLEHCHLHILDGQFDLVDALIAIYPEAEEVTVSSTTNITSESSYLLAGVYEGSTVEGVMVHAPGCGSQFFRRTLAALVHEEQEWNWRAFPKPEAAISLCKVWPATRSKSIRPG
jgi:hypothetical protein